MLRYATSLQNCGTPERSEPGEPPSTLERWSRRQPSRAERHFILRHQGEHRSCVIHAKRRVRTSGPRSPAAARADASIGTRFSVEERTLSRPRWLLPSGRTLLAKAQVAVQLVRCAGLAVELLGSHAPPINAPAALWHLLLRAPRLNSVQPFLQVCRCLPPFAAGPGRPFGTSTHVSRHASQPANCRSCVGCVSSGTRTYRSQLHVQQLRIQDNQPWRMGCGVGRARWLGGWEVAGCWLVETGRPVEATCLLSACEARQLDCNVVP